MPNKKKKEEKKKRNAAIVFFFPSFCRASATVMTNCFFQERLDLFSGLKAVFFFFWVYFSGAVRRFDGKAAVLEMWLPFS